MGRLAGLAHAHKLLQPPVGLHLPHIEVAARIGPDPVWAGAELARRLALALSAPLRQQVAVKIIDAYLLVQFSNVDHILLRVEEDRVRMGQIRPFTQIRTRQVKELDAPVLTVTHPHTVIAIHTHTVRQPKLTWTAAPTPPG